MKYKRPNVLRDPRSFVDIPPLFLSVAKLNNDTGLMYEKACFTADFKSLSLFSGSRVSLKNTYMYATSMRDKVSASDAGYRNHVSTVSCPEFRVLAQTENAAPIIGPKRNPIENAIPISAIPCCLVLGEETSVTIAVDKVILPFESPPKIL